MTLIIKNYQRTIREICDSLNMVGSYPTLWVFSAKGTGNTAYEEFGCDWDSLTSGDYAIDVATIGVGTSTVSKVLTQLHPTTTDSMWVPNLADLKIWGSPDHIRDLKNLTNGKPVVIQYHIDGSQPHRNLYHLYWNDFRELARHFKALSEEGSSHFGGNYPVGYYQPFYRAKVLDDNGIEREVHFSLDRSGDPPTDPIPWEDGQKYPARLWEDGEEGDWGYNATTNKHNKWEREFIANVLSASGTPLTGHTVPATTTWSGEIYLIGDVVIPSGVTVTINPGTVINFRPDTDVYESGLDTKISEIIIQNGGSLIANGTIQNPIIFQSSFRADGTDPSGDGWRGAIKVKNEETGEIAEYVDILYNSGKDDWGGIRNEGGTLTLQHCVISDAEVGVEVTSYQGKTTISETDLSANHFGIKVHEGASATQLELTNVGLYQSRKGIVAGLYGTGHVQLTNATIADNYQGVEFVEDGDSPTMQLKNTIVAFNEKGVYTQGINSGSSPKKRTIGVTLRYCDVYGSSEADFQGVYTAMPTVGSTGNVSVDPQFVAHASDTSEENDYHLQASSPLIDAGDPSMTEADNSTINMGRYGGTTEYTSVSCGGESRTKPAVLKTEDTPLVFSLSQNAPNPFNPETIISYSLPQSEQVKLVIYNVLGQEIRTLVNAFKPAGHYRVVWNSKDDFGRSVSSGIYFYQITAGEFLDTRKMLILK
ncbi:MAG: T9SS type A sorting domain-containing protein [Gemmatimonadetes bacterium]|nr:T9SS type A sorting domain-containing protein [Gemmatimonadota bacterium]